MTNEEKLIIMKARMFGVIDFETFADIIGTLYLGDYIYLCTRIVEIVTKKRIVYLDFLNRGYIHSFLNKFGQLVISYKLSANLYTKRTAIRFEEGDQRYQIILPL